MFKVIIGVAVATIVGLVVLQFIDPNVEKPPISETGGENNEEEGTINVSIVGEILRAEKTFSMPSDSTLNDLITAAGGLTDNADTKAFFSNVELENNKTYYIAPLYHISGGCADTPIKKININEASKEELIEFSNVIFKDVMTTSIISYRDTSGNIFDTLEEVMEVNGIGNSTYLKMRDYIILHE